MKPSERAAGRSPAGFRIENRIRLAVPVRLASEQLPTVQELTVTENVSLHGVRVVTKRLWQPNAHLQIASLQGDLQSRARVAYCAPLPTKQYAVGLELLQPIGDWMSTSPE